MKVASVKGFHDVLPGESARWSGLETTARAVFDAYAFDEIRLPIVERAELTAITLGNVANVFIGTETEEASRASLQAVLRRRPFVTRLYSRMNAEEMTVDPIFSAVTGAGVAETTNQLEYDDEVAFLASKKLYEFSRTSDDADRRPWCLTVSFSHPHDPFVARRKYWDLYENCQALDPEFPEIDYDRQDPHAKRLYDACDYSAFKITPEQVRRSRRGYFANISYICLLYTSDAADE